MFSADTGSSARVLPPNPCSGNGLGPFTGYFRDTTYLRHLSRRANGIGCEYNNERGTQRRGFVRPQNEEGPNALGEARLSVGCA